MTVKRAVIWDMDGVIVDTEIYHFKAWKKLLHEEGIELTEEEFKRTFGMRNAEIIRRFLGPDVSKPVIQQLAGRKEEYFRQFIRDHITANPGAIGLIRDLYEAGFLQAIASSAPRQNVELVLNSLGIASFFTCIVSEEDVTSGKPDPQIFLTAANRLGVEPANCVVIEDSIAGVQAANAAGMRCIALASTNPPERLSSADRIVESLQALQVSDIAGLLERR